MLDDWVAHTPKRILAKNFGVNETFFDSVPTPDPYYVSAPVSTSKVTGGAGAMTGSASFVYRTLQHPAEKVPGGGGEFRKIDSTNFPISKTIAATFVTLKPKGLRELHWHPNVSLPSVVRPRHCPPSPLSPVMVERRRKLTGKHRARPRNGSISTRARRGPPFLSAAGTRGRLTSVPATRRRSRTTQGESARFGRYSAPWRPAAKETNTGGERHYIENTSDTEDLVWVEIYKSDRVADISLTQWLALTPADMVAATLKIPVEFVEKLKKEKQILLP